MIVLKSEDYMLIIVYNDFDCNEAKSLQTYTLTTSNGYVVTVAPSFATAPRKKTYSYKMHKNIKSGSQHINSLYRLKDNLLWACGRNSYRVIVS